VKVLVLGGTQFNGLALVHELARAGHDVTVLNRGKSEGALPRGSGAGLPTAPIPPR
jgi:nucleoside-diphosphate-sugar epimerase